MNSLMRPETLSRWEEARGFGVSLKAGVALCGTVLLKPIVFFDTLASTAADPRRRLARAIVFALALGYLKLLFELFYLNRLGLVSPTVLPPDARVPLSAVLSSSAASPYVFLRPLVSFLVTLAVVCAGIKFILGLGRVLFPALLVVCYKSAADIFYAVPFVGGIFASVWGLSLIMIGVRALYRVDLFRAIMAAVLMPTVMLLSLALFLGTSFNKMVVRLYPETQPQVMRFNDMSAFLYTSSIASAARQYKNELGFFPARLELLKKYLSSSVADELERSDEANGYRYRYERLDEERFFVEATPVSRGVTGRFVLFADQTGQVRLDDAQGRVIKDVMDIDSAASTRARG